MRLRALATVVLGFLAAISLAGGLARAQTQDQVKSPPASAAEATPAAPEASPSVAPEAPQAAAQEPAPARATEAGPSASPQAAPDAATEAPPAPADPSQAEASPTAAQGDPVVAAIKAKLADPAAAKDAHAGDLAALTEFYASREAPLWVTEMGFSAKGQQVLFEIEKADSWGLDAGSFTLPRPDALTATPEAEAEAEIALDLAILKYARYARGGRFTPAKVSALFDQVPPLRDPKAVLAEIAAAEAPDAYLRSLHPKHEQFQRLREALLKARDGGSEEGEKPAADGKDIKRILINMERWRWMPEELGNTYVLQNSAAFMLYVVKDNKTIYADKTLVGTIGYATPIFTSPMTTIVFNPDWNAPETVVKENILPALQSKKYSILKTHKLFVSYNGQPVDATRVDWNRVNGLAYTFSQKAGPHNNLGKIKFLYPNRHTVYMHDTLPVRKKYFKQSVRLIGHECVRMEKPQQFAAVLLAESNGVSEARVKELWNGGNNASVALERKLPVHMVYFTAVAGDDGKVETFADVYGLDRKLAVAMFGDATGFPEPPPESKKPPLGESDASTPAARRTTADNDVTRALQGFLGD
jgi:murein L,D-transpeptidase YcbB/YkuD